MRKWAEGTIYEGRVLEVEEKFASAQVTQAYASGATVLTLHGVEDFDDTGGSVEIEGVVYGYNTKNDDLNTITLSSGLTGAIDDEAEVFLYPLSPTKEALVEFDEEDTPEVKVGQDFYDVMPVGIRDVADQEAVYVQMKKGELVIVDILGQEVVRDGSYIDPDTLPPAEIDPIPVVASPMPVAIPGMKVINIRWEPVIGTEVEVEVHMSTSSGTTITQGNAATLAGEATGTGFVVDELPDGSALVQGTTYYFWLIAKNILGAAAPAGPASGALRKIDTPDINTEAVWAGFMYADRLLAADLDVILDLDVGGEIVARGAAGQRVSLSGAEGFVVQGPDALGNPTYVSFPTDGKPNIIGGELNASVLTVEGDASGIAAKFRQNSLLEPGATLTLNDTTPGPSGSPVLENATDIRTLGSTIANDSTPYAWVGGGVWFSGEYYYIIASYTGGTGQYQGLVRKVNPTTGVVTNVATIAAPGGFNRPMGLTKVPGTDSWRVLWATWADQPTLSLSKHNDSTFALVGTLQSIGTMSMPSSTYYTFADAVGVGTDGTDIWVGTIDASHSGGNAAPRYRRYLGTLSSLTVQETITDTTLVNPNGEMKQARITGIHVGNMDFGSKRVAATIRPYSGYNYHRVIGTAGTAASADVFGSMLGLTAHSLLSWDGTRFWDLSVGDKKFARYSTVKWTAVTQLLYGWYAFFRTSDSAMTPLSVVASISHNSRWFIKVTGTTPPTGLVNRFYLHTSNSSVASKLQSTLASGVLVATYDTYNAAGAAPVVGGFGATTPAKLQSQATELINVPNVTRTSGSTTITNPAKQFRSWMVGQQITTGFVAAGTTIVSVSADRSSAVMSAAASGSGTYDAYFANQPKLLLQGDSYARIKELETLIISSTSEASAAAGNTPPLRVGDITGNHLRVDGDEIISMSGDTGKGPLYLRSDVLKIDVTNGAGALDGNANYRLKLRTDFGSGVSVVLRDSTIVMGTEGWNAAGGPTAGNTVTLHAGEFHSWTGGIYMEDLAGGGATGANINNAGRIVRTSTEKMKTKLKLMTPDEAYSVMGLKSYTGEFKKADGLKDPRRYPFFVAEQGAEAGAELWVGRQHKVIYNKDGSVKEIQRDKKGEITSFRTESITVAHNVILQDVLKRLDRLEGETKAG